LTRQEADDPPTTRQENTGVITPKGTPPGFNQTELSRSAYQHGISFPTAQSEVEKAERFAFRLSVFVLPPDYFACGKLRKKIAAFLILGFIRRMKNTDKQDSKLCAEVPHHAMRPRLSAGDMAQLGKGRGFAPSRCIPSPVPQAATETMLVSAPSSLSAPVLFASWDWCP
jgi:hypothetical protein